MIWIATAILVTLLVTTQQGDCSNTRLLTSYYGIPCNDDCGLRGESYYWCMTNKGWDYCSPRFNVDYKNQKCQNDSPCGRRNYRYNWCYNEAGSWGYCSREPMVLWHKTRYGEQCVDDCLYSDSTGYYCYTSNSWGYCSIAPDMTYNNKECQTQCTRYNNYYWCSTGPSYSDWDYCGPIERGECDYSQPTTRKRAYSKRPLVCSLIGAVQFILLFTQSDFAGLNRNLMREVIGLIEDMDIGALYRGGAGTITRTDNFRVDLQGTFTRDGRRYLNIQIQRNISRNQGQSTTVAHVEIPIMEQNEPAIPDEQVRLAFQNSLAQGGKITIVFSRSGI